METPVISIIVAVYNVDKYLKDGVNQLLAQTFKEYEILLVDDGSTDNSGAVCDELANRNDRIFTFHSCNQGSGSARNIGIAKARGKYLWFYDVDDKIENTLLERNLFLATNYNTELIIFGFRTHDVKYKVVDKIEYDNLLLETNEDLRNIYLNRILLKPHGNGFVWNKFYLRSFILENDFRFGNQRIQQDEVFNLQLYPKLSRVYLSNDVLYDYYIYDNGNTRSKFITNRYLIYEDVYNSFVKLCSHWCLNNKLMTDYINRRLFGGIISAVVDNSFHRKSGFTMTTRNAEMNKILNRKSCRDCLLYIKQNKLATSLETKLYLKVFLSQNVYGIYIIHFIYKMLRQLKDRL